MGRSVWTAALLVVASDMASAADWPQFLGPARDGRSEEAGLADGWQRGPRELWRTKLGNGYASVAVVAGVVYAVVSDGKDEHLVALDGGSGVERWRSRIGGFYADSMGFDGSRATPTVVGDRIVALTGNGGLGVFARDSGERLWAVDVNGLGGQRPQWGYSSSPLVDDGKIYLPVGGEAGLVALSLADGSVVWKRPGFVEAGYSAPVRATLAGRDQVVFFTGTQAVGVTPDAGEVLWTYPWATDYDVNAATPVVVGSNRLFVSSGYGNGGAVLLLDEAGKAVELWKSKRMKNKMATSVLHEGHLYGFNEDRLTCVDATTGQERWSQTGYGRGVLVLGDGHLFVQAEDCRLLAVEATPKAFRQVGGERRVLQEQTECWAAPALANGVLYVRDNQELVALELRSFGPAPR